MMNVARKQSEFRPISISEILIGSPVSTNCGSPYLGHFIFWKILLQYSGIKGKVEPFQIAEFINPKLLKPVISAGLTLSKIIKTNWSEFSTIDTSKYYLEVLRKGNIADTKYVCTFKGVD